jgi:hypothetical protein
MKELLEFYKSALLRVASVVAALAVGVPVFLLPLLETKFGKGHWSSTAASWLTSGTAVAIYLGVSEWLIRKHLWKFWHPELNFHGVWDGISTYTDIHKGTGPVGHFVNHQARIEQTCLSIQLIPSIGDEFESFKSTTVNLVDKHTLVYAYEVRYKPKHSSNQAIFPQATFGYEELSVVDPTGKVMPGERVRPSVLHGWFAQCAKGQEPVYSGSVVFKRKL